MRKGILASRSRFHWSSTPDRTSHPPRGYTTRAARIAQFRHVCRRVTARSRLNQCLGRTTSGPTGARSQSGARLNVPNVNYTSGVPTSISGPQVKKSSFESRRSSSCARQLYVLLPKEYKINADFSTLLARAPRFREAFRVRSNSFY